MHCEELVQLVWQALVEAQVYPLQVPDVGEDCLQAPAPSHDPVVVAVTPVPEQVNVPPQLVPDAV
jgi:hypothetical protein